MKGAHHSRSKAVRPNINIDPTWPTRQQLTSQQLSKQCMFQIMHYLLRRTLLILHCTYVGHSQGQKENAPPLFILNIIKNKTRNSTCTCLQLTRSISDFLFAASTNWGMPGFAKHIVDTTFHIGHVWPHRPPATPHIFPPQQWPLFDCMKILPKQGQHRRTSSHR